MRKEISAGYLSAHRNLAPTIRNIQSHSIYRNFFDFFGMMMIGMALFRFGVLTLDAKTPTYLGMAAVGYAVGFPMNIYEANLIMAHATSVQPVARVLHAD